MMTHTSIIMETLSAVIEAAGSDKWVLGGSAGLVLRGLPLVAPPRDIDLYCEEEDAKTLHGSLGAYAVDEPALSETGMYRSTLSHYRIGEFNVELVGGFLVKALGCTYKVQVTDVLIPYGDDVLVRHRNRLEDQKARVVPLAHELWFNALRGRVDRMRLIAQKMSEDSFFYQQSLTVLEQNNRFSQEIVKSVHRWIDNPKEGELEWMLKSFSGHPVVQ